LRPYPGLLTRYLECPSTSIHTEEPSRASHSGEERAGDPPPRCHDGYQFTALAERLARGHPYTTAATCPPVAVDAALAEEAQCAPDAVANILGAQPADHFVAATARRSPTDSLPRFCAHRQWRKSYAQRHEHAATACVASRCAHDPSATNVSTGVNTWHGYAGR
jgi:hypothetical protein